MQKEIKLADANPTYAGDKNRIHLGNNVHVGKVYFNTRSGHIYIGEGSMIGMFSKLITGTHIRKNGKTLRHSVPTSGRDIHIGKGCWITTGVIILGPVKIGDYCVIGSGSVVNKDIPAGKFAAGVPAKVIGDV